MAVIFVIITLNLVKMPLFIHVIDKTWKNAVLCYLYCACLLSLCVPKPNIEKYVFPDKEDVTGRQLCKVVFPVFCLLLPIGII